MTNQLVSVLMPMKNTEAYVEAAIRSVLRQRADVEVIVVDDGSTDGSAAAVRAMGDERIHLIAGQRQGAAAATNLALDRARGAFIAFCDADDLWPEDRLEWQRDWLARHAEFAAICGTFSSIDAAGRPIIDYPTGTVEEEITAELRRGVTRAPLVGFLLRAAAIRTLGGLRPYFASAYDIDFQLRLGERERVWYVPRKTYLWRLHGTSITHTQATPVREFYERTARAFLAQRAAGGADDLERGNPPAPPSVGGRPHGSAQHVVELLVGEAWRKHGRGERLAAIACGARALVLAPARLSVWKSLAALILKKPAAPIPS